LRYLDALKNIMGVHRPRTRSGVLDHLQEPARNINLRVVVKVNERGAG
jgi:hypothetical protein